MIKGKKNERSQKFSDHNSLTMSFEVSFKVTRAELSRNEKKECGWKLTQDGLEVFAELSEHNEALAVVEDYEDLQKEISNMMNSCFKKKKKKKANRQIEEYRITDKKLKLILNQLLPLIKQGRTEKRVAKEYIQQLKELQKSNIQKAQVERINDTLKQLSKEGGDFSVDQFWKMRKSVNTRSEEKGSIISPDGVELFTSEAIIEEYRKEFQQRLSHRVIDPAFKEYEELSNKLLRLRLQMECIKRNEPDFAFEEVEKVFKSFKYGKSCGPDFQPPDILKKAGRDLISAATRVFNNIKNTLKTPKEWVDMIIKTLFKNKGSRKRLKYHRGIFLTCVLSKALEKLLLLRTEQFTAENIDSLQCGSTKNKSPRDCIFIMNGVVDHALYLNQSLFMTSYDYATCFDSLWLQDSLLSLWDTGIQNRALSLIYELNKSASIQVNTPFGFTQPFSAPMIVKQGTVFGSKLCCASTAEVVKEDVIGGASVGTMSFVSSLYVDDCNRVNTDINDTINSHEKFINFSKKKRLPLQPPKCGVMVVNKKKHDSCPSLKIEEHTMAEIEETTILGDIFNNKGNKNSLVEFRATKSKGVIVNMLATCSEVTFGIFYFIVMMLLYKVIFIPTLLFNADAWSKLTKANWKCLEVVQMKCLKRIMKVATSTPNSFILLELGLLPIKCEVNIKRLIFIHHIINLLPSDPVRTMYDQMLEYPFSNNWATMVNALRKEYGLPNDDKIAPQSYQTWKNTVKKQVTEKAYHDLINDCKLGSKTSSISFPTSFERQPYLAHYPVKISISIFKIRARSTNCLANRGDSGSSCRLCGMDTETQIHVLNCHKIRNNGGELTLDKLTNGTVPINDEEVVEIAERFNKFEQLIKCKVWQKNSEQK